MKKLSFIIVLLFIIFAAQAQGGAPFFNEIQAFKVADSLQPPPKNAIVFVGSSSFRLWTDLQQAFPKHNIINRGFGGSSLPDVIYYKQETIFKYKPKQVVIYCGDNDLAASDTVTANIVVERFKTLFTDIRKTLPNASIVYISIKPSLSRWHLKEKAVETNRLIQKFLKSKKKTGYADVWTPMLDGDGKPNDALFVEDKLHMNREGYAIWEKKIEPLLLK